MSEVCVVLLLLRTPKHTIRPNSVLRRDRMDQTFFCRDRTLVRTVPSRSHSASTDLGKITSGSGHIGYPPNSTPSEGCKQPSQAQSSVSHWPCALRVNLLQLFNVTTHGAEERVEGWTSLDGATIDDHHRATVGLADWSSPKVQSVRTYGW